MEEFAKLVEGYKWRGALKQKPQEDIITPPNATAGFGEGESPGSVCTRSSPASDVNASSSPSPSLFHNVSHDVHIRTSRTDMDGVGMLDMPFSSTDPCCSVRSGPRHLSKKKSVSSQRRSSRQLFSIEDMGARSSRRQRVKSKKIIRKAPRKKKRIETKEDGIEFSQIEACNLPDFYSDRECEGGPKELYSRDASCSPAQHLPSEPATHSGPKMGTARTSKCSTDRAFISGKSPYFMHAKRTAKVNGASKKNKLIKIPECGNTEAKPCTRNQGKEVSISRSNDDTIVVKRLAGHDSVSSDWEDSREQNAPSKQLDSGMIHTKTTAKAKKSVYFDPTAKPLGQRVIVNKTWVPPVSVHALIQEELYQDPWKVLVACMLLNKTSGTQMRKIIWDFFNLCPTPEVASTIETSKIEEVIRGLGLQKKRAHMIQKLSKDYLGKEWSNVGQLHGIGKYATDAYAIFCEGRWREVEPNDHKLVDYWHYLQATDGIGYAFKDEREKGHELPV